MGATGLVGVMALIGLAGSGDSAKSTVDFRLQDHRGAWHSLDEARDRKVVVLVFLGVECPLAEAYAPRLAEIARDFEKRGVGVFGIDSNPQDGPVAIGRFAETHALPFPILKDVGNQLADPPGGGADARRSFVLDESREPSVYRGRIDDQYAIGVHRPSPDPPRPGRGPRRGPRRQDGRLAEDGSGRLQDRSGSETGRRRGE